MERIFSPPGNILGGREYHGTPARTAKNLLMPGWQAAAAKLLAHAFSSVINY